MKLVYVYEKNNKNVVGYVKGLHTDGYSDKMYYSITFPRTGVIEYIDINDMFRDEDGLLYYEKDNGDLNKRFINYCKGFAGCKGCKYADYDNCKELFIKDQEV